MGKLSCFFLSSIFSLIIFPIEITQKPAVLAVPLYTNSRWIVDETGNRVKLSCVNWVSHLEVMVAEGLGKQPVDVISKKIVELGFNCVRLTWPLFLITNDTLGSLTVRQSFQSLGLAESLAGFQFNNPSLVDLTLINAYQAVVTSLASNSVMVILDNHISKPGWCCSNFDGNGFFGDVYFNPDLWVKGLTRMANLFNGTKHVVGMSLRNELRGPRQNVKDWYRYMQKGAEAVHSANPDVLVILSGLNYDKDLSFVHKTTINLTFTGKLVFEVHWYGFSEGQEWATGNPNQVCGRVVNEVNRRAAFVLDQGFPLFVSEYGVDLRGTNINDNRYLNCFLGWAAELDVDWALWTLVGSYYLRERVIGLNEYYGILNWNWCELRNSSFLERIFALQSPFQGPGVSEMSTHKIIYHPLTGLCIQKKSLLEPLQLVLGPCSEAETWSYNSKKTLTIKGNFFCLQAHGLDEPAKLGIICSDNSSKWELISDSRMHLSSKLEDGRTVCLDIDSNNNLVTTDCKCLYRDSTCDPGSQWFKIINSTRCNSTSPFWSINSLYDFLGQSYFEI